MKKFFLSLFYSVMLCPLAVTGCGETELKVGTAFQNSMYHAVGNQMKSNIEADKDLKYNVQVLLTAGSVDNVKRLNQNEIQLALIQNDVSYDAYHSAGIFNGEPPLKNFVAIAGLYIEACHLVVREDSSIYRVSDLLGKSVNVGAFRSGTEKNAKEILSMYDIKGYSVAAQHKDIDKAAEAMQDGTLDAIFLTTGVRADEIYKLSEKVKIRLIPIYDEQIQDIVNSSPVFAKTVIPAHTYKGQDKDVQTLGIKTILAVNRQMKTEEVTKLTKNLFANSAKFNSIVPLGYQINIKDAVKGISIPFHPGAAKYYRAEGERVRTE